MKSAKTYEEQVELIKDKGFIIENDSNCIHFLKTANYYRLSAYYLPFRNNDNSFISGISFTRIQRIYEFDRKLRTLVFEITEEIEFYLRTQFAYYSGHKYGPLGYLEEKNYISKHNHVLFQKKINERIQENQNTNVVKHHFEKYDGKFPIWVIIEFFSLGMLSYFFSDMKNLDKKTIARDLYDTTYDHLSSWTRCLTELRNRCAHYSRIYFWKFTSIPKEPEDEVYILDRSLFSQILMLKYLYPDAEKWNNKCIDELKTLIGEYLPDISLEHIGFPENWVDLIAK